MVVNKHNSALQASKEIMLCSSVLLKETSTSFADLKHKNSVYTEVIL